MKKRICLSVLIAITLAFTLTGCRLLDIFKIITANDTITSEQELAFAQQYLEDNYDGIFVYKEKTQYDEIPGYLPHIGEPQLTTIYEFSELNRNETYRVDIDSKHILYGVSIIDSDGNYDTNRCTYDLDVKVR